MNIEFFIRLVTIKDLFTHCLGHLTQTALKQGLCTKGKNSLSFYKLLLSQPISSLAMRRFKT